MRDHFFFILFLLLFSSSAKANARLDLPTSMIYDDGLIVFEKGDKSAKKVADQIGFLLHKIYEKKGAGRFWKAEIETIHYGSSEFVFKVSKISKVILPQDYFELHLIYVNVKETSDGIAIEFDLEAKFSSGILFTPLETDYKSMKQYPVFALLVIDYEKKLLGFVQRMFLP